MPFKGTDRDAYAKASKGKTPKQRSKIYYKEKEKNERKALKENKNKCSLPNFSLHKMKPRPQSFPISTRSTMCASARSVVSSNKFIQNKQNVKNDKIIFMDKTLEILEEKIKDKIIDFAIELIKENSSQEIRKIVDTYQTIETYVKIAKKIYKLIVYVDKQLNKTIIKYELQENNHSNLKKYKQDYRQHRCVYDKYKNLCNLKTKSVKNLKEWYFGDNKQTANKLFFLVKRGIKTATSYLYDKQVFDKKILNYSILTNWDNSQKILIKTTKRTILKFKDVSTEHAYKEGEDDRTLQSWLTRHKALFASMLAEKGKTFSDSTKIVCEEFRIVKILN
ncbi:MAG: ASCH domain-containing protein [Clostridia bacterium]|nr:ASCH domain-containing protein [Clostridia bacterium]